MSVTSAAAPGWSRETKLECACLASLTALGAFLRFNKLGSVFQSSDNALLAVRLTSREGYAWMTEEYHGVLISVLGKIWTGLLSTVGMSLSEFEFKTPVAFFGTASIILVWGFMRRFGFPMTVRLWAAGITALLPIHIFQSRYLYGYEIYGLFFLLLALWKLADFLEQPTLKRALAGSLAIAVYMISHGYFIPGVVLIVIAPAFLRPVAEPAVGSQVRAFFTRWAMGIADCLRFALWLFPVLAYPLYRRSLEHALGKDTRLGFYLDDHFMGMLNNVGIPLALVCLVGLIASGWGWRKRGDGIKWVLLLGAGGYFAPLLLSTPPGLTVVRGYMLVGSALLLLASISFIYRMGHTWPASALMITALLFTAWGVNHTLFIDGYMSKPTMIRIERGQIRDPGTKAAGYLIRQHLPRNIDVVALHRAMEPPNLKYYADRKNIAWYDRSLSRTQRYFDKHKTEIQIVLADRNQAPFVRESRLFEERVVFSFHDREELWIFVKPEVAFPSYRGDTAKFNEAFDRSYGSRVSLF